MDASRVFRAIAIPWRRLTVPALAILVLALSIQYSIKTSEDRSAFVRWRNQLHALGQGTDIYQQYIYPNAPMMALILYPLSLLPKVTLFEFDIQLGAQCWFFLKVAMTVLSFHWTFRLIQEEARPFPAVAQGLTLLLSLRPIVGDLTHGNVNLLILFLVVAMLYAFKRGHDVLAGLLLALAITCKVTPALFLPYFLWKRAWKSAFACIAGLGLFFFVIPGMFLGHAHNWTLLSSWTEKMILPYAMHGEVTTEHCNQSLPGLIYRLGTDSPSFLDEDDRPADYHNLASMEASHARWLVKGCGLAFLALLCWSCRTPAKGSGRMEGWKDGRMETTLPSFHPSTLPGPSLLLAAEYSIVVLGMLLFSERTWKHHCVTLLLPFGVLCYYLVAIRPRGVWRGYLIGSIFVATMLFATTSTGMWEPFSYRLGAKMAQVYGAYVWGELVLLAALVAILTKHRPKPHEALHEPTHLLPSPVVSSEQAAP